MACFDGGRSSSLTTSAVPDRRFQHPVCAELEQSSYVQCSDTSARLKRQIKTHSAPRLGRRRHFAAVMRPSLSRDSHNYGTRLAHGKASFSSTDVVPAPAAAVQLGGRGTRRDESASSCHSCCSALMCSFRASKRVAVALLPMCPQNDCLVDCLVEIGRAERA